MSRQLRIQYPGAIYHVTSRGDRRQAIVTDDTDRDCFFDRIRATVEKFFWEVFAVALMTNHFHLFFRTPAPNLSRGMQYLLGGYARWWNTRQRRTGHVFQGRFRGHLIEDETYFWTVSRYVHLNPVPVLVQRPEDWRWSSYAGYVDRERRLPWIQYDTLLQAWQGTFGGGDDVIRHYRQYVESGLSTEQTSPFESAIDGWILGSVRFAEHVRKLISPASHEPTPTKMRRTSLLRIEEVMGAVCEQFGVDSNVLAVRGSRHPARPILAYLGHHYTAATLREIAQLLGLSRPDSVPTQIRRLTNGAGDGDLQQHLLLVQERLEITSRIGTALPGGGTQRIPESDSQPKSKKTKNKA